jgi:hypothetical protein
MATNRIKQAFADGLLLLVEHKSQEIRQRIPLFWRRGFQAGNARDLSQALEYVNPKWRISEEATKAWYEAQTMPKRRSRDSLSILLGPLAQLLFDGEDISQHIQPTFELAQDSPLYDAELTPEELRREVRKLSLKVHEVFSELNALHSRLK